MEVVEPMVEVGLCGLMGLEFWMRSEFVFDDRYEGINGVLTEKVAGGRGD